MSREGTTSALVSEMSCELNDLQSRHGAKDAIIRHERGAAFPHGRGNLECVRSPEAIGCTELGGSAQLRAIDIDQTESTTVGEQSLVPCCQGAIAGTKGNDQHLE